MVSDEYPWPARTGYRIRLAGVIRALAATASVDLLAVVLDERSVRQPVPPDLALGRCAAVAGPPLPLGRTRRAVRWAGGTLPRALLWRDWRPARAVLQEWAAAGYDAVWFSHAPAYLALGDLAPTARIVDLDNLDAFVLRHRRGRRPGIARDGLRGLAAARARALADAVDERRWHRVQDQVCASAEAVVVCSELDRRRLGSPGVLVVPNGYEPDVAVPARAGGGGGAAAPVLLMVGLLTYEANQDAAEFFAAEVLPRVRAVAPAAAFRVVGRWDDESQVAALRGRPGVSLAGEVADVRPELATADLAVVPIRFGGGTRIKILEAFAHGLPVVSTTVGCEGLAVADGEHLLVADDPAGIAAACLRLLADADLRARLAGNARAWWARCHRWDSVAPAVTAALARATGDG